MLQFQLQRVLFEHGLDKQGIFTQIAADLGLCRRTVSRLYHGEITCVSMEIAWAICTWLQANGVPAELLPQALFGRPRLWEVLAGSDRVRLHVARRPARARGRAGTQGDGEGWVAARDFELAGRLSRMLSLRYGRTLLDPGSLPPADRERAGKARRLMLEARSGSADLILGSRGAALSELAVADLFAGAEPFRPGGSRLQVPFHLTYPEEDGVDPSCFSSTAAPPRWKGIAAPGLYYPAAGGVWKLIAFEDGKTDAAAVIVSHDPGTGSLEIAIVGYTPEAAALAAGHVIDRPDLFWPLAARSGARALGVFACRIGRGQDPVDVEVTPLDAEQVDTYAVSPSGAVPAPPRRRRRRRAC